MSIAVAGALGLAALGLARAIRAGAPGAARIVGLICFAAAGFVWGVVRLSDPCRGLPDGQPVALYGEVESAVAGRWPGTTSIDLRVEGVRTVAGDAIALPALASCRVRGSLRGDPAAGDRVLLRALLHRPLPPLNPGQADRRPRLLAGGIGRRFTSARDVTVFAARPENAPASGLIAAWRASLSRLIAGGVDDDARGVLDAALLGRYESLPPRISAAWRRVGLSHLLVVSGLHLGVTMFFLAALLRRALLRWLPRSRDGTAARLSAAAVVPLLLPYVWLTGDGVATRRAALMAACLCLAILLERPRAAANLLGCALLAQLAFAPAELFTLGMQLSYVAVAGILFLSGPLKEKLKSDLAAVSTAAGIATAPVLWMHGITVSVLSIPLNLVCVPLATFVLLPAGYAGLAFSALTPNLAPLALWPAAVSARAINFVAVTAAWSPADVALSPVLFESSPPPGAVEIVHAAVRQGDAALVTFPDGRTLLVDAGNDESPDLSGANNTVLNLLAAKGVRRLDFAALSHLHADHYGGMPEAIRRLRPRELWIAAGAPADNPDDDTGATLPHGLALLDAALDEAGTKVVPLSRGAAARRFGTARVDVLNPPQPNAGPPPRGENNRSLVLRIATGESVALLTGDIERAAERDLVARYGGQLRADWLKAPHQGSITSSSPEFIDAVRPGCVVVPVGAFTPFPWPHPEVVRRYAARNATMWRTGRDGAVTVRLDAGGAAEARAFLGAAARCGAAASGMPAPAEPAIVGAIQGPDIDHLSIMPRAD